MRRAVILAAVTALALASLWAPTSAWAFPEATESAADARHDDLTAASGPADAVIDSRASSVLPTASGPLKRSPLAARPLCLALVVLLALSFSRGARSWVERSWSGWSTDLSARLEGAHRRGPPVGSVPAFG